MIDDNTSDFILLNRYDLSSALKRIGESIGKVAKLILGLTIFKIFLMSFELFSIGVPVSAQKLLYLSDLIPLCINEVAFRILCASSAIIKSMTSF